MSSSSSLSMFIIVIIITTSQSDTDLLGVSNRNKGVFDLLLRSGSIHNYFFCTHAVTFVTEFVDEGTIRALRELYSEDSFQPIFSQVTFADIYDETYFHAEIAESFLISTSNKSIFYSTLSKIAQLDHGSVVKHYYVLLYPDVVDGILIETFTLDLFNMTEQIDYNSNLYIVVASENKANEHEQVDFATYEIFHIKDVLIIQLVNEMNAMEYAKVLRRSDFHQVEFVASTTKGEKYEKFVNVSTVEGVYHLEGGLCAHLYLDLMKLMNYTERIVIGDWIPDYKNETMYGETLRQITSGIADISIIQGTMLEFRAKVFTFLQPTFYSKIYVFFERLDAFAFRNLMIVPFDVNVWFTFISICIFIGFCTVGVAILKMKQNQSLHEDHQDLSDDEKMRDEAGLFVIACISQKSFHLQPGASSMRLLFVVSYALSLVSFTAYTAATLSVISWPILPLRHITDLLNLKYTFTVHESSGTLNQYLKGLITQYNLTQKPETVVTKNEVSHLIGSSYAFLSSQEPFYEAATGTLNISEDVLCKTVSSFPVDNVEYPSAMFLRKGTPYREVFNYNIIRLKEGGLNHRYVKAYHAFYNFACNLAKTQDPLSFHDVYTALGLVFAGLAVSGAILSAEVVYHFYKQKAVARQRLIALKATTQLMRALAKRKRKRRFENETDSVSSRPSEPKSTRSILYTNAYIAKTIDVQEQAGFCYDDPY